MYVGDIFKGDGQRSGGGSEETVLHKYSCRTSVDASCVEDIMKRRNLEEFVSNSPVKKTLRSGTSVRNAKLHSDDSNSTYFLEKVNQVCFICE